MSNENTQPSGLEQAPAEVKLAVDLIYLLETNEISPEIALKAIDIVRGDLLSKVERA
ncbi:pleiotropic regulatory protein RsmS [Vibrio agarivorans]|uniref:Pleiotropic regulatory protein RsmS n=1 Tax=Vibrio agarivorans TaxID=153622 RepID=A0ABT7XY85_9VIBR|nr:pleiotropic regulatory protein RsmS [Vibrio agarivorans]MDN2480726.1 pleiotropic regulatory protein RsmS [Vibrio agarivorans]